MNHLPSGAAKQVTAASRFSVGATDVFGVQSGPQELRRGAPSHNGSGQDVNEFLKVPVKPGNFSRLVVRCARPRSVKPAPLRFPGIRRGQFNLAELYYYARLGRRGRMRRQNAFKRLFEFLPFVSLISLYLSVNTFPYNYHIPSQFFFFFFLYAINVNKNH